MIDPSALSYDDRGLLAVVVQEVGSGAVLMLGWADREAVERTLATGEVHFFSRSRARLWRKGETSGNVLNVAEVLADCDSDALLVRARAAGPTCHRGSRSCFEPNAAHLELGWLYEVVASRRDADPAASHTARLLAAGIQRIAQKVGEEGVEVALAAVAAMAAGSPPGRAATAAHGTLEDAVASRAAAERTAASRAALIGEAADLLYHLMVLLAAAGVEPGEVAGELLRRSRPAEEVPE